MSKGQRLKPYVCVDIDLPSHHRLMACQDPAGCLGLWLAMLCYAREHLTDGRVPKRYAISIWGDRKNASRIKDMVASGLLTEDGGDYEVTRYAPRNQTKAEVEGTREGARVRMATKRASAREAKEAAGSQVVPENNAGTSRAVLYAYASASKSDLDPGEPERGSEVRPVEPASRPRPLDAGGSQGGRILVDETPPPRTLVDLGMPITEAMRARACDAGIPAGDVDQVWETWKAGKKSFGWLSTDWEAAWYADIGVVSRRHRIEREKRRGERPGDDPTYVDPMSAEAADDRRRRQDRDLAAEVSARLAKAGGGHHG